jgi:hypothetical protein
VRAATREGGGSLAGGWPREDLAAAVVVAYLAAAPVAFARDAVDGFEQVKLWALPQRSWRLWPRPGLIDPQGGRRTVSRAPRSRAVPRRRGARRGVLDERSDVALGRRAAPASPRSRPWRSSSAPRLCLSAPGGWLAAAAVVSTAASTYAPAQALSADPCVDTPRGFSGWSRPFGTMGHRTTCSLLAIVLPVSSARVRRVRPSRRRRCPASGRSSRWPPRRDVVPAAWGEALRLIVLLLLGREVAAGWR